MTWIAELLGTNKPIIAMGHLLPLPGDPGYDRKRGMECILDHARADLEALQLGGVDAIMFSNEASRPYLTKVDTVTVAAMAAVIGELRKEIKVPFGVNVLWDPIASIDLAAATGATFIREIFTGVYASDFGLWNTNCGASIRHKHSVGAENVRLFFNIVPESAAYLSSRDITDIARSTVFNNQPDALCVSGLIAGDPTSSQVLSTVKTAVPDTPVFANTGVHIDNIEEQLSIADGAIVGTTFKKDGHIWNPVDPDRVMRFMDAVQSFRSS